MKKNYQMLRLRDMQRYKYIHGYFVASFPYFNGTGSVYVCIGKSTEYNEARAHIATQFDSVCLASQRRPLIEARLLVWSQRGFHFHSCSRLRYCHIVTLH